MILPISMLLEGSILQILGMKVISLYALSYPFMDSISTPYSYPSMEVLNVSLPSRYVDAIGVVESSDIMATLIAFPKIGELFLLTTFAMISNSFSL